jgi:ABC-type polysaccharide/polyol phosphate export permease
MNFKNIVTNLLGLVFWIFAVYEMTHKAEIYRIVIYVIVGASLFLFENNTLKEIVKGIISKITLKK